MAKKITPVKKVLEKVKAAEIALTDMTAEELKTKARELREKIVKVRLEAAAGKAKNLREAFMLSDQLARTLTVLNTKKMS